jgi:hypothetical protein
MDEIAEFIVNNIEKEIDEDEELDESVMQCGAEMDMSLNDMRDELLKIIDINKITEFTLYPENHFMQRKTVISFKWHGKTCEIGEHYGTQRDYFWVTIKADV